MSFINTLSLAALLLLCTQIRADMPTKQDKLEKAKLVGTYEIVGGEKGGKKIEADRLKDAAVQIAANAITTFDKDKKEVYAATYELDASRKPWRIAMIATITPVNGKGSKSDGLIEVDGNTVKLIYALPGGRAPTQFKTEEKQQMFVLKKTDK